MSAFVFAVFARMSRDNATIGLLNPPLLLESRPELVSDFLGGRLFSALNLTAATILPIRFDPGPDNESNRIGCGNKGGNPYRLPGVLLPPDCEVPDPSFRSP